MPRTFLGLTLGTVTIFAVIAFAAVAPRYSLENLVDRSAVIVEGRVTRTWTAWDSEHKYIWTHYELTVSDHIRGAVMTKQLMKRSTGENLGRLTISVGVAMLRPDDTPQTLMERADTCLYIAKRSGRNRVVSEADPEVSGNAVVRVA